MSTSTTHRRSDLHVTKNGKANHAGKAANGSHAKSGHVAAKPPIKNGKPTWFTIFAQKTAQLSGRPVTFLLATLVIIVWGVTGPLFGYSDTWQLVINTGTTIVTFLMVFLIQNTQNRDTLAIQVKLDELIIKLHGAGNELAGAEDLCDEDLEKLHDTYRKRAAHAHDTLEKRRARWAGLGDNMLAKSIGLRPIHALRWQAIRGGLLRQGKLIWELPPQKTLV